MKFSWLGKHTYRFGSYKISQWIIIVLGLSLFQPFILLIIPNQLNANINIKWLHIPRTTVAFLYDRKPPELSQFEIWNGPRAIFACQFNPYYSQLVEQHMRSGLGISIKPQVCMPQTHPSQMVD